MHEASVAQSVLEIVEGAVQEYPNGRVVEVQVSVGALAHIDDDSLRFAFDVLKEGTVASEARLCIDRTPLRGSCRVCREEYEAASLAEACPSCGSSSVVWLGGEETEVCSVEIEE